MPPAAEDKRGDPAAQPPARVPGSVEERDDDMIAAEVEAILGSEADAPFEGMLDPPPWHIVGERIVVEGAAGDGQVRRVQYLLVFEGHEPDPEAWYTDDEEMRCCDRTCPLPCLRFALPRSQRYTQVVVHSDRKR